MSRIRSIVRKVRMKTGSVKSKSGPMPKATVGNRKAALNKGGSYRKIRADQLKLARKLPNIKSTTRTLIQHSDGKRLSKTTSDGKTNRQMYARIKKQYRNGELYKYHRKAMNSIDGGKRPH